jgi:hypothetical protein
MPSEFLLNARQLRSTVVVVQLITVNSTVMMGEGQGKMKPERKMAQNFF